MFPFVINSPTHVQRNISNKMCNCVLVFATMLNGSVPFTLLCGNFLLQFPFSFLLKYKL